MNVVCLLLGHDWHRVVDRIGVRELPGTEAEPDAIGFQTYATAWHDECGRCGERTSTVGLTDGSTSVE